MSEDRPGERVPWDELEPSQKDMFTDILQQVGLDVGVEEAEKYYGNKELVEEDSPYQ